MRRWLLLTLAAVAALPARARAQEPPPPGVEEFTTEFDRKLVWTVRPLTSVFGYLYEGAFGEIADVAWDPVAGEVWIADSNQDRIGIFDWELYPVFAFGGRQVLPQPRRLAVSATGDLYSLYGRVDAVRRFNYRGDWLGDLELPPNGSAPIGSSLDLAPDGLVLVGDAGNGRLVALDPRSGRMVWELGSPGIGEGHFIAIAGAAYSPDGAYLYVADRRNIPVVQVFQASDRHFLFGWGERELGRYAFKTPADIAVAPSGLVLVADTVGQEIKVFDSEGGFVMNFGSFGKAPGQFAFPVGVAVTAESVVYVAEKVGHRVQAFELFREIQGRIPSGAPRGEAKNLRGSFPSDLGPRIRLGQASAR